MDLDATPLILLSGTQAIKHRLPSQTLSSKWLSCACLMSHLEKKHTKRGIVKYAMRYTKNWVLMGNISLTTRSSGQPPSRAAELDR